MIRGEDVKLRSLMLLICLFGAVTAACAQQHTGAKNGRWCMAMAEFRSICSWHSDYMWLNPAAQQQ